MKSNLKSYARNLRKSSTDAERILWHYLRNNSLNGFKFKRQQPLGKYIVDFICFESKLIIELDGSQHFNQINKDKVRDNWLERQGFKVLRILNNEFLLNQEKWLEVILDDCVHPSSGLRPPSPTRGEGHIDSPPTGGEGHIDSFSTT